MLRKRKRSYIKHSNKTTEGRKRGRNKEKVLGQLTENSFKYLAVNPAILISKINMNDLMHIIRLSEWISKKPANFVYKKPVIMEK